MLTAVLSSMDTKKAYIGDGVYATYDGMGVWLETERDGRTERIYLEPAMVEKIRQIVR